MSDRDLESLQEELEQADADLANAMRCMESVSKLIRKTIAANDHAPGQVREWYSLIDADAMLVGHRLVAKRERMEREQQREEVDEFSGRARAMLGVMGRAL
jgi:hypothetical protein